MKSEKTPLRLLLAGACGNMGHEVCGLCREADDIRVVCGIDRRGNAADYPFPLRLRPDDDLPDADVLIDFSSRDLLPALLSYAVKKKLPAVIGTTALREEDEARIKEAAHLIPVFRSRNLSVGVHLLNRLVSEAAKILGDTADVEIIEAHHAKKADAPSGTALMLADAVRAARPDAIYRYDRHLSDAPRAKAEIGIHTVRGGGIAGEHLVLFAGKSELLRFSHTALSRSVFAEGAVRAARYLCGRSPGLYGMDDLLENRLR